MSANIDVLTGKREGSNGTPQAHEDGRKRLRHTHAVVKEESAGPLGAIRECEDEEIHMCGAVQSDLGAMIVVADGRETQNICMASDNAFEVFACEKERIMSGEMTVEELLGPELMKDVSDFYVSPHVFIVRNSPSLHLSLHKVNDYVIIEAEPKSETAVSDSAMLGTSMSDALVQLHQCTGLAAACDVLVNSMKQCSGFSRVMVYKFHSDHTGEVIAEAKDAELEPFLGLRYPASDIPEQARRLYIKNWIRVVNANGVTSALRPCKGYPSERLDLTMARYRACSPVHIMYLQNMGVCGSMSLSLVVNGKLWGLVACHNYVEFRPVSLPTAVMYEVLARSFSLQIFTIEQEELRNGVLWSNKELEGIMKSDDADLPENMSVYSEKLMKVFKATGCIVARTPGHVISCHGSVPSIAQIRPLLDWLATVCTTRNPVFRTDCLSEQYLPARQFPDVMAGLLAARMTMGHYILLLRPEHIRTVNWGGKPEKTVEEDDEGLKYYGPRRSFALYSRTVKYHSTPWSDEKEAQARQLSYALTERQTKAQKMLRDREAARSAIAAQSAYMLGISRELQSPVSGIMGLLGMLSETKLTREQLEYLSTLTNCSDHMMNLTGDLLSFSRNVESFIYLDAEPFRMRMACEHVIDDIKKRYTPERLPAIEYKHLEIGVPDDAVLGDWGRVCQVILNLMANAVNATEPTGKITVTCTLVGASSMFAGKVNVSVEVADTGCGIHEEHMQSIFDSAFAPRMGAAGEGNAQMGPGVGLSISRKLATSMHGDINAKSEVGVGSVFTFKCVLDAAPPAEGPDDDMVPLE